MPGAPAAQRGDGPDCFRAYAASDHEVDLLIASCRLEVAEGCYYLAGQLELAGGQAKDEELTRKSGELMERTCAMGFGKACLVRASRLENQGQLEGALGFYQRLCDQGEPTGCREALRLGCQLGQRADADCAPAR